MGSDPGDPCDVTEVISPPLCIPVLNIAPRTNREGETSPWIPEFNIAVRTRRVSRLFTSGDHLEGSRRAAVGFQISRPGFSAHIAFDVEGR